MKTNRSDSPREYRVLGISFLITGVALLVIGALCFLVSRHTLSGYVEQQATITDISDSRTAVSYTCDGQRVSAWLHEYHSKWRVGDAIPIYYDPAEPATVTTGIAGWLAPLILGVVGGVFLALGAVFCSLCIRIERKRRILMDNGEPLTARVTSIRVNYAVRVNMRHPVRLQCGYTGLDGTPHVFLSQNVWTPLDDSVIGKPVTVYVDRNDMDVFYVDTDSLEGLGGAVFHGV